MKKQHSLDVADRKVLHHLALRKGERVIVANDQASLEQVIDGKIYKSDTGSHWGEICKIADYALEYRDRWSKQPGFYERYWLVRIIPFEAEDPKRPWEHSLLTTRRSYVHIEILMAYDQDAYHARLQELFPLLKGRKLYFGEPEVPVAGPIDTPFWEGDWVLPANAEAEPRPDANIHHQGAFMVDSISFEFPLLHPTEMETHAVSLEDPAAPPRYRVNGLSKKGYGTWSSEELVLVERGNLWRRAHGEPFSFATLDEHVAFAYRTRAYTVASAPDTKMTWWHTREEAFDQVVTHQLGDGIYYEDNDDCSWGFNSWWSIAKFEDEALGQQVREATKHGYVIPSRDWLREQARLAFLAAEQETRAKKEG